MTPLSLVLIFVTLAMCSHSAAGELHIPAIISNSGATRPYRAIRADAIGPRARVVQKAREIAELHRRGGSAKDAASSRWQVTHRKDLIKDLSASQFRSAHAPFTRRPEQPAAKADYRSDLQANVEESTAGALPASELVSEANSRERAIRHKVNPRRAGSVDKHQLLLMAKQIGSPSRDQRQTFKHIPEDRLDLSHVDCSGGSQRRTPVHIGWSPTGAPLDQAPPPEALESSTESQELSPEESESIDGKTAESGESEVFPKASNNTEIFQNIYTQRVWGDQAGGSGGGSVAEGTNAGKIIKHVMSMYNLTSLLDAPCGAVHAPGGWTMPAIKDLKASLECFTYHGVDVVPTVVAANQAAFAELGEWSRCTHADLGLPGADLPSGYDLILSRDALQHMSFSAIAGTLHNYCASDARYLLVGTYGAKGGVKLHPATSPSNRNRNINNGGYFAVNVLDPPFDFPETQAIYKDTIMVPGDPHGGGEMKQMLLYSLQKLCKSPGLVDFVTTHLKRPDASQASG